MKNTNWSYTIELFIANSAPFTEFRNRVAISSYYPLQSGCCGNPLYVHNTVSFIRFFFVFSLLYDPTSIFLDYACVLLAGNCFYFQPIDMQQPEIAQTVDYYESYLCLQILNFVNHVLCIFFYILLFNFVASSDCIVLSQSNVLIHAQYALT